MISISKARHHVDEALQELLDGRLAPTERLAVEAHLQACTRCQRLRMALERSRVALRFNAGANEDAASALRSRIVISLGEAESPRAQITIQQVQRHPRFRLAWAAAAGLFLAVGAAWVFAPFGRNTTSVDPIDQVAENYQRLLADSSSLRSNVALPSVLERQLAASGLPFRPRFFDLAAMGYELAGSRVQRVGFELSAVAIYRNTNRTSDSQGFLICEMYRGRIADLATADQVVRRGEFSFHLFRRGATRLVFWQEGDVVCALAAEVDAKILLKLAAQKAMLNPTS